jgi:hypothetical protein
MKTVRQEILCENIDVANEAKKFFETGEGANEYPQFEALSNSGCRHRARQLMRGHADSMRNDPQTTRA